jgi:hypothetical protein
MGHGVRRAEDRGQKKELRIANCGFKNKAEDKDSLVGAAFPVLSLSKDSRDLAT